MFWSLRIFLFKHITNLSTTLVWKLDCRAFWNFCWHWLSGSQKLFTGKVCTYEVLRFGIIFIHLLSNNNMNIHAILLWKKILVKMRKTASLNVTWLHRYVYQMRYLVKPPKVSFTRHNNHTPKFYHPYFHWYFYQNTSVCMKLSRP